jgi:hypothetical protein
MDALLLPSHTVTAGCIAYQVGTIMTTNSLNKPAALTRSAKINAAKQELNNETLLALAATTGKKADRANAADAALSIISKLLTGQAAGGNREQAVLVLRACMGLEAAAFDNAFARFSGSLSDVAALGIWAKPHQAALSMLTQREEDARKLGIWIDAQARFEREGKALRKAADAANADKVAARAKAFLDTVAPYIDRAQAKLAEIAARKAAQAETAEA